MKKVSTLFKEISDKQLKEDLRLNSGLFLFNYAGASSADLTQLRRDLNSVDAKIFVTKNSFISLALKTIDIGKKIKDFVEGPTALVFVKDDPVAPSKVLTKFAKTHESIVLRGGYIGERVLQKSDFKFLSSIPPREVLYQQVATAINGPVSKLAMSLNQILAKIAYALKAIGDKKKEEKK